jgi:hypothetical protein
VDIFYPSAGTVFSKEGVFQQPRDITSITLQGMKRATVVKESEAPTVILG